MNRSAVLVTLAGLACVPDNGGPAEFPSEPLTAVAELRVGSADDPELAFTWFRTLVVGPDGRIYTAHPQEYAIRMHDANGAFVGSFGRSGEGPGEFRRVGSMGMVGDTIWVLDHGAYRFNFFDLEGRLLGSHAVAIDLGTDPANSPPRPSGMAPDGTIIGSSPGFSHLVVSGDITETAMLRLDSSGAVIDTLATRSLVNTVWEVTDPNNERSMRSYREQPFADTEILGFSPQLPLVVRVDRGLRVGDQAPTFRVTAQSFDGDTVYSRAYAYTPKVIDADLSDSLVNEFATSMSRMQLPSAPTADRAAEWARSSLYNPGYHPPVGSLLVGRDGSVWLSAEQLGGQTTSWRVLSPEGDPLGVVELPNRFRPLLADSGLVWGIEYDDLDIPYIVRFRIEGM